MKQFRVWLCAVLIGVTAASAPLPTWAAPWIESEFDQLEELYEDLQAHKSDRTHYFVGLTSFQDILIQRMRESSDVNSFEGDMLELSPYIDPFLECAKHAYQLVYPRVHPQIEEDADSGESVFLNTYKLGRRLSAEERAHYYEAEVTAYKRDQKVQPFQLDAEVMEQLKPGVIYNFVLLPNMQVHMALEKPTTQPYQAREDAGKERPFAYPNHTVLAGDPQQGIITGGALVIHQFEDKRLIFMSNKSGHFLPNIESLAAMREWLGTIGVAPETVIPCMEVNYAKLAFIRPTVRLPLSVNMLQAERLADNAYELWSNNYNPGVIAEIAKRVVDDPNGIPPDEIQGVLDQLHEERQNALRMRAVFRLLHTGHEAPKALRSYTKWIGKLKDGLEFCRLKDVQKGARKLLPWLETLDTESVYAEFEAADADEITGTLHLLIADMQAKRGVMLLRESDYHRLKKDVRNLSYLFWLLAADGEQIQMHREVYRRLTNINVQMGEVLDKIQHLDEDPTRYVRLNSGVKSRLGRVLTKVKLDPEPSPQGSPAQVQLNAAA